MRNIFKRASALSVGALMLTVSCTKLKEDFNSSFTEGQAEVFVSGTTDLNVILLACYDGLQIFQNQDGPTSLMENSSDESLVPTRGGDWDDNGVWRVIHNHTWDAEHQQVNNVFNGLLSIVFNTTNVLKFIPNATAANKEQVAAEARF
ncbi:MAG: hypothetical protein EAZ51_00740, partial [Sphingobacteriales bacterium]